MQVVLKIVRLAGRSKKTVITENQKFAALFSYIEYIGIVMWSST